MICRLSADYLQICSRCPSRSVADYKQICSFRTGFLIKYRKKTRKTIKNSNYNREHYPPPHSLLVGFSEWTFCKLKLTSIQFDVTILIALSINWLLDLSIRNVSWSVYWSAPNQCRWQISSTCKHWLSTNTSQNI